jgi:LAGLIDADG DNA endonuclease family protein
MNKTTRSLLLNVQEKRIRDFFNTKIFGDTLEGKSQKLKTSEAASITLTPEQREILLGTVLGDGSLKFELGAYKNARFGMRHSSAQLRWFLWKAKKLNGLFTRKAIHLQKADGAKSRWLLKKNKSALSNKSSSLFY